MAYGFTVIRAGTGFEAFKKLSREKIDGIFLDIKMPEMDGLETLGEIRKKDQEIPVIIITASSNRHSAAEALSKKANDYILKPFDWREMKTKIERVYKITL